MDYLQSQFIDVNDIAGFTEEELTAPILTRDEFERQQAVELYREKAHKAGTLWDKVLSELSSVNHKWKWDYMDYLEDIKYKNSLDVTLSDAKEEILSYEEFAELKGAEGGQRVQATEMMGVSGDAMDEVQVVVVSEEVASEIIEIEEVVSETVIDIPEEIDYTKLSIKERAALLPVPTDDYEAEYDAYCQRMGYTAEKMKSIRYKMALYDEFLEEYNYRKKRYGIRNDLRMMTVSEKNRGAR